MIYKLKKNFKNSFKSNPCSYIRGIKLKDAPFKIFFNYYFFVKILNFCILFAYEIF